MIKIDNIIIPGLHVFVFISLMCVGYLLSIIKFHAFPQDFNFFYQITGGLGVFIIYCIVTASGLNHQRMHFRDYDKAVTMISVLGILNLFVLSFLSVILIFITIQIPNWNLVELNMPIAASSIKQISNYQLLSLLFSLYCIISYWVYFKVYEETIVIHEDKWLFPGENYIMWPFFVYNNSIIDQEVLIKIKNVNIICSDGEKQFTILFAINLDIEKMQRDKNLSKNFIDYNNEATKIVLNSIKEQAKHIKEENLLNQKMSVLEENIDGFHFTWDGNLINMGNFEFHPE